MGYIEAPILDFWSVTPVGSGTTAHVVYSRASTWAKWAELPGPGWTSDPRMVLAIHMYPLLPTYLFVFPPLENQKWCA